MKLKKLITGVAAVGLTLSMGAAICWPYIADSSKETTPIVDASEFMENSSEEKDNLASNTGNDSSTENESNVNNNSNAGFLSNLLSSGNIQSGSATLTVGETWRPDADETRILWVETADSDIEDADLKAQIQLFSQELTAKRSITLPIVYGELEDAESKDIILVLDSMLSIPTQGYKVEVDDYAITISASDDDGLFYGCRYLIQQMMLYSNTVSETTQSPAVLERAVMLDNGRKYFSPDEIEKLIKEMSWSNMNTLIMHFSDEMGLGLESTTYPNLAGRDGTLCVAAEIDTDDRYLTQDELRAIAQVAKLYHVEIVPSFDSPGHMNYLVKRFNANEIQDASGNYINPKGIDIGNYYHYNNKTAIVQGSRNTAYSRGIDISNETAVEFTRSLIEEYARLFKELGCTKFDIGGDELLGWGASIDPSVSKWKQLDHWKEYAIEKSGNSNAVAYDGFLIYMNSLYELLSDSKYGYTSIRMWNDDALRTSDTGYVGAVELNKNIEVQYWSDNTSGNHVTTFLNAGYKVYNFFNTYNYYVLNADYIAGKDYTLARSGSIYNNWNPYVFSTTASYNTEQGDSRVLGSAFCVWCDNPSLKTDTVVVNELIPLIRENGAKAWDPNANTTVSHTDFLSNVNTLQNLTAVSLPSAPEVNVLAADTTELQELVAEFATYDAALYTTVSFSRYQAAVEAGQAVINSAKPTTADVNTAVKNIEDAKSVLREVSQINEAEWFIQGAFRSTYAYNNKVASLSITTTKDAAVKGFKIVNDLGDAIEITQFAQNKKNTDKDISTIMFSPSAEEVGMRKYTVYAIFADGTESETSVWFTLEVK